MAEIWRLRVTWGGTPVVGGGLSTFYADNTVTAYHANVADFFDDIKGLIPAGVTWQIPNSGDKLESTTGTLLGGWTEAGGTSTVLSTGTADFANGVGFRVVWNTDGIFRGRRVKGSTFIVPITNGLYHSNGTIYDTAISTATTAAQALVTNTPELGVWSRPGDAFAGEFNLITSTTVPDKVSWLRSRRT